MGLTGERTEAMRDDARQLRESVRKDNLEEKLEDVIKERPGVKPFLDLRPLLIAVGIAAVLTLIATLLLGPAFGALVLVLSFAISWVTVTKMRYDERRPTKDADAADDDETTTAAGNKKSEVMPFSS
jgi:Flp pilus assembly protein TadB